MTEQTTPTGSDANSVRKVITVQASPAVAWRVFTEKMSEWWPLATHKIGKSKAADAFIEPRVGGRWYERGEDGTTCDWGRVLAWEPNTRLVLSWNISADWQHDPQIKTEVEVRFVADGERRTRVELEHRQLDQYGSHHAQMRDIFDSEGGWSGLLASFARAAAANHG